MTAPDFCAALKALGITQRWLAGRLGVATTTVNRWALGQLPVPQYAVAYLELMQERAFPSPTCHRAPYCSPTTSTKRRSARKAR